MNVVAMLARSRAAGKADRILGWVEAALKDEKRAVERIHTTEPAQLPNTRGSKARELAKRSME